MSEVQETRKPNRFRITSVIIACLMLVGAFGILVGPITINVSAVPDTEVWDGGGANALASTKENWVGDVAAPDTGDVVVFNAGALPCTWDIAKTFGAFYMNATYTGTITQAASFGVSSFTVNSGTLTPSVDLITCSGDFTWNVGTIGVDLSLDMTGNGKTLYYQNGGNLGKLSISGNTNIDCNGAGFTSSDTLTIDSGKTMTIMAGHNFAWKTYNVGVFVNDGTVAGPGTFELRFYNKDMDLDTGTIDCPTLIELIGPVSCNANLTANADFANLTIDSTDATATMTLDLSASNFDMTVETLTIGTRGILTPRTGTITCSGDFLWNAGTVSNPGPNLIMTGDDSTLFYQNGGQMGRLEVSGNTTANCSGEILCADQFTVRPDSILSLINTTIMVWKAYNLGYFFNDGVIDGLGLMSFRFYNKDMNLTFGTIECLTEMRTLNTATQSCIATPDSDSIFRSSLNVYSSDPAETMTLNLTANNYNLTARDLTVTTRGILDARGSSIKVAGDWDTVNGTFTEGTSTVVMEGSNTTVQLAPDQKFHALTVNHTLVKPTISTGSTMMIAEYLNISQDSSVSLQMESYTTKQLSIGSPPAENQVDATGKTILCLGDSLTGAADYWSVVPLSNYWPYDLQGLIDPTNTSTHIWNRARGGHAANDLMVHLAADMAAIQPNIVIVFLNIDRGLVSQVNVFKAQQLAYVNAILAYPGVTVIWSTMAPWGDSNGWAYAEPCRLLLNAWIMTNPTGSSRCVPVNMEWYLADPINANHLRPEYIMPDGTNIHLSVDDGAEAYARGMYAQMFDGVSTVGLVQNGYWFNISGTNPAPVLGYGLFDGHVALNGSEDNYAVQLGVPFVGWFHTLCNTTISTYPGRSLGIQTTYGYYLNVSIESFDIGANGVIQWTVNPGTESPTITFTLAGLENRRMYRLHIDNISSALLTASGTGVASFDYSGPWSEHQFEVVGTSIGGSISGLVNLIFIMFAVGIVVGVIAEGTNSLRKMQMRTTEKMVKTLLNMVIYIVIGIAGLGVLYSIVA